jgi:hypothetical protein
MIFDPRSRRFDPNWPLPAIETDWSETSDAPGAALVSRDAESTDDPLGSIIAEALEQLATERCCVCPLCGAIVASDGSVLN